MTFLRPSRLLLLAVLVACGDKGPTAPPVPGALAAVGATSFTAIAGSSVAASTLPSVKVTTSRGRAVVGAQVLFAVTSGGGSIPGGGTVLTDAAGVAVVPGWTLGTTAGTNVMTATVTGVPPVTFTVTGAAGAPAKLALVVPPSATAANRVALATQPVVQVQDANSNLISTSTAAITASITNGGGTLQGTTTVNATGGVATFSSLAIAGTVGARTLSFGAPGLQGVSATVTTTAGAAASMAINGGNNQNALTGAAVAVAPSVIVRDEDANPVAGVSVVFAVSGGGGSVTGGTTTTGADGIATVGSWTLGGTAGVNTMTATAATVPGGQVTFTATAAAAVVLVNAVTPATLTPGAAATITGSGFSPTLGNNTVTVGGVAVTVTAATATTLSVTLPAVMPCTPTGNAEVAVTVGGATGTRGHPLQVATQHALAAGQSVVLSTAAAARCNELSNTGGVYYVNVYNTNTTYSPTGAAFELKGTSGAAALRAASNLVSSARRTQRAPVVRPTAEAAEALAHVNLLERDLQFLKQNGRQWRPRNARAGFSAMGNGRASAVGDAVTLRLRDIRVAGCNTYLDVTGRIAYEGTRAIIVEDIANPLAGTIDTTYAQIGNEFDTVMWPILEANFGNALANDAVLDNNGRIVMVFSTKVNTLFTGIAGFVSPCDFFQRTTFASSNVGEYFYARAPEVAGTVTLSNSPPNWRWSMRTTIMHEVKHIVSSAERFSRNNGTVFEESWLEETTARLSEELYERARYNFAQRANIGYGSQGNPVGPYCGVRPTSCGQARGFVRAFEDISVQWYAAPELLSPIGRRDQNDFSFYQTGWSLLRWAIDESASPEATILRGMTQDPTRTGVTNFEQHTGTTLAAALPKWTMAMVVDDHPGFTPADASLRLQSWNLRDVFLRYDADFAVPWVGWPLDPFVHVFGNFSRESSVVPATAAVFQLTGAQSARQLLELKASGANAAAPAELRMIIVRVQ